MEVPEPGDEELARAFEALSSPTRLAMLRGLRLGRTLAEIEVSPADASPPRPAARQTVRSHLNKLLDAGIVQTRPAEREYGTTTGFVVNHQTLYHLSEMLRLLSRLSPEVEPELATLPFEAAAGSSARGPCLIIVKGAEEGRRFPLERRSHEPASWTIGRRREAHIALDFDAALSSEHARIAASSPHYTIEDLPTSRNGTTLNFARLPKGSPTRLRHGDIVGVGRSLLVYWS